MSVRQNNNFYEYVAGKNIIVGSHNEIEGENHENISFEEAKEKVETLAELHKRVHGYVGDVGNHLPSSIGQLMEGCKVSLRRLKRDIANINNTAPANSYEKTLEVYGEGLIERGERSITLALSSDYIKRIYRSMNNNEICIGTAAMDSFEKREDYIYLKTLRKCSYNLIECDGIDFISRLKRRGIELPYNNLIALYIEYSQLDEGSYDFIRALVNYPYEAMKLCNRYRSMKKPWTPEKYAQSLLSSIIKDGEEI